VAGSIPVGAKVSIHHSRGGIICLPVMGSGDGTSLLTVDVPIIVSAAVDPDDPNYWILVWTPGENNQNVSVNYQTTAYPSAPGTVLPYGNSASCATKKCPVFTMRLRIRFSGPSTTYYVKLWGEKNGNYSATGATATVTSGPAVTPIDTPEEPDPITVVDTLLAGGFTGLSDGTEWRTVFEGELPLFYNGTDNVYIGGPPDGFTAPYWHPRWGTQPTPRYLFIDDYIRITVNGAKIDYGATSSPSPPFWWAPVNIKSLLSPGRNVVKIELSDYGFGAYGVSDIWVRTYYL